MNRIFNRLGFTALALVAGVVAQAQTATTGAINGVVRDASGNPLAGATVIASSAQITRTTMTAADGTYRLALLNPGDWTIKATKGGLAAPTQRATVLLNAAATYNFKLASETSAVVTVVAAAETLDLTTTQTGSSFQLDAMKAVPLQRDYNQLVLLAPGTISGGTMGGQSVSGGSAIENNFVIDGLDTTNYRLGFQGASMPTDFVDQVEVQTGGFRPEYSAMGGVVNAITKSGTNQFAGSAWFTNDMAQNAGRPEGNNYYRQTPSPAGTPQPDLTVQPPTYRYDFGFTAGGALVTDKLFYFVGFNQVNTQTIPTTNLSGLTDSPQDNKLTNVYGKVNYFISQNQQLSGTIQYIKDPINQDHVYPPSLGNRDFGFDQTNNTTNWSLNYDWTINPSLLLSVKYGASVIDSHTTPTNTAPSITDYNWFVTGPGRNAPIYGGTPYGTFTYLTGGSGDWNNTNDTNNQQFKVDLSWFLGNHALKFGYSHDSATSQTVDAINADDRVVLSSSRVTVTQYANLGSKATLKYDAIYAQDQWEIIPGLRLAYGFREEYQTVQGNRDQTIFSFKDFGDQLQPRIGVTWDVNNDGKTKLSANFAIYDERFPMQAALRTGGNETYQQFRFPYSQPGNTYNTATGGYTHAAFPAQPYADYSGFFRDDPQPLDGLKVPKREEIILGADHTFDSGWTVGVHGKYRKLLRMIEDTVPTDNMGNPIDGAGFSILWNPEAGKTYQWANNSYISAFGGTPGAINTWQNNVFPDPKNIYESLDLTLDKKTDRYTLSASLTWSHVYGNYEGVGQTSNGQSDANITSTWDYAPYVGNGPLPLDHTWNAKLFGSYTWDLWGGAFSAGGSATLLTGAPRTIFDDGTMTLAAHPGATSINGLSTANGLDWGGYGNATPLNFTYGNNGRENTQRLVNLHFDYAYKFSNKVKLTPSIDIFNAFNTRTETVHDDYATTQSDNVNPAFGAARQWLAGRMIRYGVKVTF
ncbi:MAG: TonB-dependent receptor [Geothrix sp.]|nr:TonB-dependent receptor [Geothrix sp.]